MTDPIAELYAVPPSAFTRARNAKVAALEKAGREADARAVRQLRRPPAGLWAANQLARAAPEQLEALADAVDRARRAQLRDPRAAGEAVQRLRADLEVLVVRAGQLLTEHGYHPTPATLRRISDTLIGASSDRRFAQDLRRGRLTTELAPPGFEILAGADQPRAPRVVRGGREQAPPPARQRHEERRAQAEEVRHAEREAAGRKALRVAKR
ncbi:MAG TPA: hypothetical protein VFV05_24185 [Methylomirabilota bacterium]|nr:hypothetical protein [Methylomirabilota bacterium]